MMILKAIIVLLMSLIVITMSVYFILFIIRQRREEKRHIPSIEEIKETARFKARASFLDKWEHDGETICSLYGKRLPKHMSDRFVAEENWDLEIKRPWIVRDMETDEIVDSREMYRRAFGCLPGTKKPEVPK